jgi:hypothetical protein|eukprot:COSAG06_NODE_504_length_14946_cov_34.563750_16_plen_70_part_00
MEQRRRVRGGARAEWAAQHRAARAVVAADAVIGAVIAAPDACGGGLVAWLLTMLRRLLCMVQSHRHRLR